MRDRPADHLLLLDDLHSEIRARHLSHRTEQAYASWVERYIRFHRGRHPAHMGTPKIDAFLTYLSAHRGVAASDVLFIDSGTGPDIRYLILVDVAARRRLTELSYVELVAGPDSLSVGVWDGSELEEPAPGCTAPRGGLVPGVDSLFFLDVRSGQTRFSGRTRCAQRH